MSPADVSEVADNVRQQMLAFFCDHLVSLAGTFVPLDEEGQDAGEESFFALSGFVVTVRGVWCLVTAGHAVQTLEDRLAAGAYRLTNCCLGAHFGSSPQADVSIPFDLAESGRLWVNAEEEGLDFALLTLDDEQRAALERNGIRPISEENWVRQNIAACEIFALVGLPTCLVSEGRRVVPYGQGVAGVVSPALAPVERVELSPDEMPPSTYPWFVGRVGGAVVLPDVDGMSGGPIFGFFKDEDGVWRYWIVALQSRWNAERRIVFACPMQVIGRIVEAELRRYADAARGL
jgi:hypothetical protein